MTNCTKHVNDWQVYLRPQMTDVNGCYLIMVDIDIDKTHCMMANE